MKRSMFKLILLTVAVFSTGFIYWNLPISDANIVYAVSHGVIPNDGLDDTQQINSAVDALKQRGGGKLVLPAGQVIVSDRIYFAAYGNYVSFEITGDGTEVLVNGDSSDIIFYFGNNDRVTFDGLTFVGRNVSDPNHPEYIDCAYLIFANYVDKLIIRNTSFIGIRADVSIVYTGIADTVVENTNFGGSSGKSASLETGVTAGSTDQWFRGLTVRNTTFLDYGNYRNASYWKSSSDNNYWIKAVQSEAMRDSVNAMHNRLLRIEDSRFDEAATIAIGASNVEFVKVEGINVNVNSVDIARAIDLSGVHFAEINYSRFGFTNANKPAVRAVGGTIVEIKGITLGSGVKLFERDKTSKVSVIGCFGQDCPTSR